MISGRVGANNTAELGTMVVTEQIDALRALAIDPIAFLIAPRFLAIVATLFMMTIFADLLALFGAAYAGQALLGVAPVSFYNGLTGGCSASATSPMGSRRASRSGSSSPSRAATLASRPRAARPAWGAR